MGAVGLQARVLPRPISEALEQLLDLACPVVYAAAREHLDLGVTVGKELDFPTLARHDRQHHDGIVPVVLDGEGDALGAEPVEEADELVQDGTGSQPSTAR